MSEPFLIAHVVRGEAAFDVAIKMQCPHCHYRGCIECDTLGWWWIIPTSGHRAYPFANWELTAWDPIPEMPALPSGWPDHYRTRAAPKLDITSLFKTTQPPKPHIVRRL